VIDIVKTNKKSLIQECDRILEDLAANLEADMFEDQAAQNETVNKLEIENNELNEDALICLNKRIAEMSEELNGQRDRLEIFSK